MNSAPIGVFASGLGGLPVLRAIPALLPNASTLSLADTAPDDDRLQPLLTRVLEPLLALAGIASNGMVRDATWAFVDAGLRVERAQRTADRTARTIGSGLAPVMGGLGTDAVRRVGAHRRGQGEQRQCRQQCARPSHGCTSHRFVPSRDWRGKHTGSTQGASDQAAVLRAGVRGVGDAARQSNAGGRTGYRCARRLGYASCTIAFSRTQPSCSTAGVTLPHGCRRARRLRQSNDLGWSARM